MKLYNPELKEKQNKKIRDLLRIAKENRELEKMVDEIFKE